MTEIPFGVTRRSIVFIKSGSNGDGELLSIVIIKAGGINLPIGIGQYEAHAIMALTAGREPDADSPDDLLRNILVSLGASVIKIGIVGMSEETFFAKVFFERGAEAFSLTAFVSEAIILGLTFRVPMFIDEQTLIDGTSNDETQEFLSVIAENAPHALGLEEDA